MLKALNQTQPNYGINVSGSMAAAAITTIIFFPQDLPPQLATPTADLCPTSIAASTSDPTPAIITHPSAVSACVSEQECQIFPNLKILTK
jgi:hypothetical protein